MKPAPPAHTGIKNITCNHLIIGSGIAGLSLALRLAQSSKVLLIAKSSLNENNTWHAQGGIASVLDEHDSFDAHTNDTLLAGAGLCKPEIVDLVVRSGPKAVRRLIEHGVQFTQNEQLLDYHLTREGGHSHRRVIHAADATGKAIMAALIARAREHNNIQILEHQIAIDLITTDKYAPDFRRNRCLGAYVLDHANEEIYHVRARHTYLCTGGHGKVYLYTSNPDTATGDGLAMAWRAGCRVANLEFMQFHPTCLFHPQAKHFLISEAVRGEGGVIRNLEGYDFVKDYHPMGSLAPRDIVARAIDSELKRSGDSHVLLDVVHLGAEQIRRLFPYIHKTCLSYGFDMTKEPLPIVPAAHYSCGGIVVDEWGRTDLQGLFAIGETACTGLHGANRLASNSLLEAVVFSERAATKALQDDNEPLIPIDIPDWDVGKALPSDEQVVLTHAWDEIRRLMWNYVGIVRSDKRLKRALSRINALKDELDNFYWEFQITDRLLEVRNLCLVGLLTIRCAMARKESRGIHFSLDYPLPDGQSAIRGPTSQQAKDTVLR